MTAIAARQASCVSQARRPLYRRLIGEVGGNAALRPLSCMERPYE